MMTTAGLALLCLMLLMITDFSGSSEVEQGIYFLAGSIFLAAHEIIRAIESKKKIDR